MTTLGQVLYEAQTKKYPDESADWDELLPDEQSRIERQAQAVAAVVREQCAQAGDRIAIADPECDAHDGFNSGVRSMQASIRSMKL